MTASSLRRSVRGTVHLPGDAHWDAVRQPWQLRADQHPAAVVVAEDAADVAACVAACAALGLRVAPQGTGHGAAVLPSLEGTVLLRTTRLDGVEVDPDRRVARVGAGVTASAVAAAAGAHGLAAVLGMAPTVGVAGLTLGGGLGWLVRSHGTAARQLLAADVVDAEGTARTVTPESDPELLWALRGGSAPVVVTPLELQLHPLETLVTGGMLCPLERAAEVAAAWRTWALAAPEQVGSLLRILRYPPIPDLPEPLRGRAFVGVEVAIQRSEEDGVALLKPLLDLEPEMSTVGLMPAAQLSTVHGDPPDPSASFAVTAVLRELSEETVDRFVAAVDGAGVRAHVRRGARPARDPLRRIRRPAPRDRRPLGPHAPLRPRPRPGLIRAAAARRAVSGCKGRSAARRVRGPARGAPPGIPCIAEHSGRSGGPRPAGRHARTC